LQSSIPFAVVASTDFVKNNKGKSVRARQYPWGIVEGDERILLLKL
jgi:septin family protein